MSRLPGIVFLCGVLVISVEGQFRGNRRNNEPDDLVASASAQVNVSLRYECRLHCANVPCF